MSNHFFIKNAGKSPFLDRCSILNTNNLISLCLIIEHVALSFLEIEPRNFDIRLRNCNVLMLLRDLALIILYKSAGKSLLLDTCINIDKTPMI